MVIGGKAMCTLHLPVWRGLLLEETCLCIIDLEMRPVRLGEWNTKLD